MDEQQQRLDFVKELRPRFDVLPDDAPSQSTCCNFNCNKLNMPINGRQHMVGPFHVYCSPECMDEGHRQQYDARLDIGNKALKIEEKLLGLNAMSAWHPTFDIHNYLTNVEPGNMYKFFTPHDGVVSGTQKVKEYFIGREDLIKLLIQEAFSGNRLNKLALDIALVQCKDLFRLDKFDRNYSREDGLSPKKEYLLNLLLFTGRYEEHYNKCCYYVQRGEQFDTEPDLASPFDVSIGFTDTESNDVKSVIEADVNVEDITSSYFEEYDLHYRHFPRLSTSHMFINKYTLHMNMEGLRLLRYNVLDNEDCIALIGEYIGLKKEWLKYEKNWYKDQAIEVLKEFTHSEELASQFGVIHGCSDIFLGSGHYNQISRALKIGRGMISKMMMSQEKGETGRMSEHWISDLSRRSTYNDDHVDEFHDTYVRYYSDELIQKLNEIVGYTAFGASHFSISRHISATEFFKEIYDICENNSPHSLQVLFDYMDEEIGGFSYGLLECLLCERKQIQAHFYHIHCFGDDGMNRINKKANEEYTEWDKNMLLAHGALDQIPSELSPYSYRRPLPLPDDDPFLNHPLDFSNDYLGNAKKMQQVGGWLSDVTRVIDALFHRGLATDENLTAIFGNSSMVSYRLYELRKIKAEKNQTSITSFFSRKKARRG